MSKEHSILDLALCGCCGNPIQKHEDLISWTCLAYLTGERKQLIRQLTESRNGNE